MIDQAEVEAVDRQTGITADGVGAYLHQRGMNTGVPEQRESVAESISGLISAVEIADRLHHALSQQVNQLVGDYWQKVLRDDSPLLPPGNSDPVAEALRNFKVKFQDALHHLSTSEYDLGDALTNLKRVERTIATAALTMPAPVVVAEEVATSEFSGIS